MDRGSAMIALALGVLAVALLIGVCGGVYALSEDWHDLTHARRTFCILALVAVFIVAGALLRRAIWEATP